MKKFLTLTVFLTVLCTVFSKSNRHVILHKASINTAETPSSELLDTDNSEISYQWMVHVTNSITKTERANINALAKPFSLGIYLPHNTYLLYAPASIARKTRESSQVLWIGILEADHKLPASFETKAVDTRSFVVMLAPQTYNKRTVKDAETIAKNWETVFLQEMQASIVVRVFSPDRLVVEISKSSAKPIEIAQWIARQPESHWIEPNRKLQFHNNHAAGVVKANDISSPFVGVVNSLINGSSQVVGLADSGLDYNSCYFSQSSPPTTILNEAARKVVKYLPSAVGDAVDDDGHGTFMAGTIAGESIYANGSNTFNGVAPGAKISFFDISTGGAGYTDTTDFKSLMIGAYLDIAGTFVATFGGSEPWYSILSADIDDFTYGYTDVLVVVAAGNGQLSELALSKNALVVGASQSDVVTLSDPLTGSSATVNTANKALAGTHVLASFSAHGPTPDGRMKPDVVAPGQRITSAARGGCGVETREGTSYAAAVAGGASAIVRDWFTKQYCKVQDVILYDYAQTAALTKAMLINSGQTLKVGDANGNGDYIGLQNFWPSSYQGFGRIQLDRVLSFVGSDFSVYAFDDRDLNSVVTGATRRYCFSVNPNARYVKITLVWSDPAGSPTSGHLLLNDLDLVAYDTLGLEIRSQTANGDFDRVNNVEQIYIEAPAAGMYAYAIHGFKVVTETAQQWALVATGDADFSVGCELGNFDNSTYPVCPNGCSNHGTCNPDGTCTCAQGYVAVDCSQTPCISDCGGNGVCNHITSTCTCNLNYDPATGCTIKMSQNGQVQAPPPVVITQQTSTNVGYYIGVGILGLVVGGLIFAVVGFFCAVRVLEKRRDAAMNGNKEEMD